MGDEFEAVEYLFKLAEKYRVTSFSKDGLTFTRSIVDESSSVEEADNKEYIDPAQEIMEWSLDGDKTSRDPLA